MDGRQPQDQQPPRCKGRAFSSPQPYQPWRHQQQLPTDGQALQQQHPHQHLHHRQGPTGGRSGGGGGRGGRPRPAATAAGAGGDAQHQPRAEVAAAAAQQQAPAAGPLPVEALVAAAADARDTPAGRAAALQQLHQRLFEPVAQRQALQQLQLLWPRLLTLLWEDPSPTVTAAAAPAVGAIGALAAQAAAAAAAARATAVATSAGAAAGAGSSGSAGGLLFDWLLPVLQRRTTPTGHQLAPHQLVAVLAALRDCLAGVDAVTLSRYANAVFAACQVLLEDEGTPAAVVQPLLAVLQQAAKHQHSLKARFQDLVDLILGWALEPALPDAARPALSRTLAAFGAQWRQQPAFTATLLSSLLSDMQRFADSAATVAAQAEAGVQGAARGTAPAAGGGGADGVNLRRVVALAACLLPMLDAAAAAGLPGWQQHLQQLLAIFRQAALAAAAGSLAGMPAATVAAELAGHAARLASLAPAAAATAADGQLSGGSGSSRRDHALQASQELGSVGEVVAVRLIVGMQALSLQDHPLPGPGDRVRLELQIHEQQPQEPAAAGCAADEQAEGGVQQLFSAGLAFCGAAASQGSVLAQPSAVLAVLGAARSWTQQLIQRQGQQQGSGAALMQLLALAPGIPGRQSSSHSWLLDLRSYSSREVVLQTAQLLLLLLQHSPAAALAALLEDTKRHAALLCASASQQTEEAQQQAGGRASAAVEGAAAAASAATAAAVLQFNLQLLLAAVPQLPAAQLRTLWQQLLPLARLGHSPAGAQPWLPQLPPKLWQLLLSLLLAAAGQLARAVPDQAAAADIAGDTWGLLAMVLLGCGSSATGEPVTLLALQWLEQAAGRQVPQPEQHQSVPASEATRSDGCGAALRAALACAEAPSPAVRTAALAALRALVSTRLGSSLLLQDAALAADTYQAALLHLSDSDPSAAAAARQLLGAAAALLALRGSLAASAAGSSAEAISSTAATAAAMALAAQQAPLRTAQLQQLLDHLTGEGGPTAALTAAGMQHAQPLAAWLPSMLLSMQAAAAQPARHGSGGFTSAWQPGSVPSCLSHAAWWAVQEAAKQCVASRLRTHHGGPAQTLAALERALQTAVGQQQQPTVPLGQTEQRFTKDVAGAGAGAAPHAAALDERRQAVALLLLFLQALEQGVSGASTAGGSSRAAASEGAIAFFAANDKACQAWFARVRPALMRAAAAAQLHELAAFHALLRLHDLHQQLQSLLPTVASPEPAVAAEVADTSSEKTDASGAPATPAAAPLEGRQQRISSDGEGAAASNPAAALLAATRGSPDTALRQQQQQQQQQPGSPATASHRQLTPLQLQQAAAKVAEAAAAASAALCCLGDADSIAGLAAYCRQAFAALLMQLSLQQGAPVASPAGASDAAAAAWDWLEAVQMQAEGRYEAAVQQYSQLGSASAPAGVPQCVPAGTLARLVADSYAACGDVAGLRLWLQSKLGSRLRAEAASRCMQLADWETAQQQLEGTGGSPGGSGGGGGSSTASELLRQLQLSSLDPGSTAPGCCASLPAAAPRLADLAAESGQALPLQLPGSVLLEAAADGNSGQQLPPWVWASAEPVAGGPVAGRGRALQPLLRLLSKAAVSEQQRALLLLAAARVAATGGNNSCAQRLLARAEQGLAAPCSTAGGSSVRAAGLLLLRLQDLAMQPAEAVGTGRAHQALQLLLAARGHAGVAGTVVPAAAQLLLAQQHQPQPSLTAAELAGLAQSVQLSSLSSSSSSSSTGSSLALLEQQLLQQGPGNGHAAQYVVLKAAVAACPGSAPQWWRLAAWLGDLGRSRPLQSEQALAQTAEAAAFAVCCKALALAGASSSANGGGSVGGSAGGYGMLPALLMAVQLLSKPKSLPADTADRLAAVPATAWLPVVPQLLSQLDSSRGDDSSAGPAPATQQQALRGLLLHAGDAAPSQVLLPAMVAAQAQPAAPAEARHASALLMLLRELQQRHALLARQLAVLAGEAARLAVLPEEHWQAVLLEAAATAAKRLQAQQRQQAAAAAAAGSSASEGPAAAQPAADEAGAEAYLAGMAPVLLCLQQQLLVAEAAEPGTPHERRFQQQHLPRLRQLVQQLQGPLVASPAAQASAGKPAGAAGASSEQLRHAVALLRTAAGELGESLRQKQLALADVTPALAELADTGIPIPGTAAVATAPAGTAHSAAGAAEVAAMVTLAGVAAEVAVLSTKTRPKRLRFIGSDGRQHSFLLKGREDLRADARLMQLLRACHSALQCPATGRGASPAVHCFDVTPLGSRLGLVQWVDGTVPLYELYTGWQQQRAQRQRMLAAAAAQEQAAVTAPAAGAKGAGGKLVGPSPRATAAPPAGQLQRQQAQRAQQVQQLRPIDLYYAKLKEAGVDPATPRDTWPLPKLIRVLGSMQEAVDRQLLWRELWLGSTGAADWWCRQQAFAASAAAMSMVGHLIGLGDRHLDNMLLHQRGGHLVHIDFSVLFDRGLQLKAPEVVPFRLTQTLVAALGITGIQGAFRALCERTLRALRANSAPLGTLLECILLDPAVDWDSEAAAKAASKAFADAVALRLFALRQAGAGAALSEAARAASAGLSAAAGALEAYVQQFMSVARTAAAAAESHGLLQRCQAVLSSAAAQEAQLTAQAQEGQAALASITGEAEPVAAEVLAALQECQAWQQRHDALLALLLGSPPAALLAGPSAADPLAAAAAGTAPPLLLVSSPLPSSAEGAGEAAGAGSIIHAALGMLPAHAPLPASLLLQAAAADKQGQQLLQERAAAAAQLAAALQQYSAAVTCLLGGPRYAGSSQHAHWVAAYQAALDLPAPQGFKQAAQLAPKRPEATGMLTAWRPMAAAAAAAVRLCEQLGSTEAALQIERVDVALAAADARERLLEAAAACWLAASDAALPAELAEQGAAGLARGFAAFSDGRAEAALQLAAGQHAQQQEGTREAGEELAAAEGGATAPLDGLQQLILGYASTAVAVRDATSEELFCGPDGSNLLAWLSEAVQAADSVSTAAAELQLLLPALLALLSVPGAAEQVSAAVESAADELEAAAEQSAQPGSLAPGAEETAAAAAMQPLLAAAAQHPPLAALLQGLQRVQAASQLLLPLQEQPSLAQQQLLLAGAVVGAWQGLEEAVPAAGAAPDGEAGAAAGEAAGEPLFAAADADTWQCCSAVLAEAMAAEVAQHLLPPLVEALRRTADQLRAAAGSLARRAGLEAAASAARQLAAAGPAAAEPELVPFTDFDSGSPAGGLLLGSLEEELEPAVRQPGGAELADGGAGFDLVPFLDFDEGLGGADDLLGSFEPAAADFDQRLEGASRRLSQQSDDGSGQQQSSGASSAAADWRCLAALLAAAAEASGALAAIDAARYVSQLAGQQAQQLRQRHCADLAALQWLNEHLLPAEAAATAAHLLEGSALSATSAAAAGAPLPPVHPAVAGWALRSSRAQLLRELQAASGTLLGLDAPIQQWQRQLATLQQQLASEVAAAMPFASADLQQHLQRQAHWLQAAGGHAASLLELSQAVLQLEASRTAGVEPASGAGGAAASAAQPLDRYQAEQQEGWQRYHALLQRMQELHGSYMAAERIAAAATSELEQLRLRAAEAQTIAQRAEAAGAQAAAAFASSALPLVKATQQLPTAMGRLLPQLAGSGEWAAQLAAAQRWTAQLAAAAAAQSASEQQQGLAAVGSAAHVAAEQLAAAAGCARQLPAAAAELQAALLPVRNRLLAGGRGEAAAQQQAADVVDTLSAAVTQLQPQLEEVGRVQQWLAALPISLQALAVQAEQQGTALQQRHGFSLQGLEQLACQATEAQQEFAPCELGSTCHGALTGSLLLSVRPPGGGSSWWQERQQERQRYAVGVLRGFQTKLRGGHSAEAAAVGEGGGSSTAAAARPQEAEVAAEVQRLMAAATSSANLARMYEGWMPWV